MFSVFKQPFESSQSDSGSGSADSSKADSHKSSAGDSPSGASRSRGSEMEKRAGGSSGHSPLALNDMRVGRAGLVPVMKLPAGALGGVLRRDTSQGASRLINDQEFLKLLAATPPYRTQPDAPSAVSSDIVNLECFAAKEHCIFSAGRLKWGLQEVLIGIQARSVESRGTEADSEKDKERIEADLNQTILHVASTLNMIQRAASHHNDSSLWRVLSEFFEGRDPSLSVKLRELSSNNAEVMNGAASALVETLIEKSKDLLSGNDQVNSLLIANLILKRIVHLFEEQNQNISKSDLGVATVQPESVCDVTVKCIASQLAYELQADSATESPLITVLWASGDSSWRLFEHTLTGLAARPVSEFPDSFEASRSIGRQAARDRVSVLREQIEAACTMIATGCKLWPKEYGDLVQRKYPLGSLSHQVVYLRGMSHGISKDRTRSDFVVKHMLEILTSKPKRPSETLQTQTLQHQIERELSEIVDNLAEYLDRDNHSVFTNMGVELKDKILWKILVPSCDGAGLLERKRTVLSLFLDEVTRLGPKLFTHSGIDKLLTPDLIQSLHYVEQRRLLTPIFDGVIAVQEEIRQQEEEDVGPIISQQVVEQFRPLIHAFGAPALIFGLSRAFELHNSRARDAISIFHVVAKGSSQIDGSSERERAQVQDGIINHLLPIFLAYANTFKGVISRAVEEMNSPKPDLSSDPATEGAGVPNSSESSTSTDDIFEVLVDEIDQEDDEVEVEVIPRGSSKFAYKAVRSLAASLRELATSPCMEADTAQMVCQQLDLEHPEVLLTKIITEAKFSLASAESGPEDQALERLIRAIQGSADGYGAREASNVYSVLAEFGRRQKTPIWRDPRQSHIISRIINHFEHDVKSGYAWPVGGIHPEWGPSENEAALALLLSEFENQPFSEARKTIDMALFRATAYWIKNFRGDDRLTLLPPVATDALKRMAAHQMDPKAPITLACMLAERINGELSRGGLYRLEHWVVTDVVSVLDQLISQTKPDTRIKLSRNDHEGSVVHHVLNNCRDAIGRRFDIPEGRSGEDTSRANKYRIPRQSGDGNDQRLME